jgi:cell division septation protein DedD
LQEHLKERLTGAAILVAVVVLLVPALFHGRPTERAGSDVVSSAGPPVRSVTIDLADGAASRPLTENSPASLAPPAAVGVSAANPPASAPTTVAAPAAAPAAAAPAAAAPASTPSVAPAASASAPAHGSSKSSAESSSSATQSRWTVQVGSFSHRDLAERMVKDVAAKGFTVEVAGPDDRGLYRVRSAPRADRSAALALKQKMQAAGLKPIVNKAP